jgi:hypothetical protein
MLLGLLSCGCGLLLEHAAAVRVRRALLLPLGFAVVVVAATFTTSNDSTARLTVPTVIALAVAGLAFSLPWRRRMPDGWAALSALGAYVAFGAPVILSGKATFAGYVALDDTSNWMGFADQLLTHGRTLKGVAPSTYQAVLNYYWTQNGYPVGAYPPLGIGHILVGTDSAWLVQPYIAFLGAILALSLYGLVARPAESPRFRALAAVVAAQPALLYAYSLWGGIKEMAVAGFLVLAAALTPTALRERREARSLLPLATVSAALVAVLNVAAAVWLGPLLLMALVVGVRRYGVTFARSVATFAAVGLVLSIPSLISLTGFVSDVSLNTKESELGNLVHPLSWLQLFGIWPVGDFRFRPGLMGPVYVLIGIVIAAGAAGLAWSSRCRRWELPLYVGSAVVGSAIATTVGSPWIGAKALAIASPAVVIAGMTAATWLFGGGRRIEAAVVAALIAGGVLWSNALAYHDAWLAPRGQLRELERIGKVFAGDGPTLITEYQPYGVRHFLRNMDAESPSELRLRPIPLRNGLLVPKGEYKDLDEFELGGILVYRTLVLPHSPSASQPPSVYRLAWSGRFYNVWQRPVTGGARILAHLPVGHGDQAVAIPKCHAIVGLGRLAAENRGRLAAAVRPAATVVRLSAASLPPTWQTSPASSDVVYPRSSGTVKARVVLPRAGRYGIWLGGSFRRSLEASIDGHRIYRGRDQLIHDGIETRLGDLQLDAGAHEIALWYGGASFRPGSGGSSFPLGPVILSRFTDEVPVTYVDPTDARSLCGKSLDWVEALGT